MQGLKAYSDLLIEINNTKTAIQTNLNNVEYYLKIYSLGEPVDISSIIIDGLPRGTKPQMTLDCLIERITLFKNLVDLQTELLDKLEQIKKVYDDFIEAQGGLKYIVIYLYYIQNDNIKSIADKLNYSDRHIARILSNIRTGFSLQCHKYVSLT